MSIPLEADAIIGFAASWPNPIGVPLWLAPASQSQDQPYATLTLVSSTGDQGFDSDLFEVVLQLDAYAPRGQERIVARVLAGAEAAYHRRALTGTTSRCLGVVLEGAMEDGWDERCKMWRGTQEYRVRMGR